MRWCNNYFEVSEYSGTVTINDGVLENIPVSENEYLAISGSRHNDGVTARGLLERNESFNGRVWVLHPPKEFLLLCDRISQYDDKNPAGSMVSESFGGYSYNRGSGSSVTGTAAGWQQVFAQELRPYRRMFTEVSL